MAHDAEHSLSGTIKIGDKVVWGVLHRRAGIVVGEMSYTFDSEGKGPQVKQFLIFDENEREWIQEDFPGLRHAEAVGNPPPEDDSFGLDLESEANKNRQS
jgi:hypothetical protein